MYNEVLKCTIKLSLELYAFKIILQWVSINMEIQWLYLTFLMFFRPARL